MKDGPVWALGAMSGTSLDGVDAAMLLTDGRDVLEFGDTAYRPYAAAEQATLRAALGHWPGSDAVRAAARVVETAHLELLERFRGVELVGFHGQTLAHDPGGRGTHQAGDGAALARDLGLPVVWDFRTADVAAGGQGAPLVPFFHHACARWMEADQPLAFLNLGGVGNVTWVDPRIVDPEKACLAFDTGPANAPINDLMMERQGQAQDAGGALAAKGQVDGGVLARYLDHPYFFKPPPKSLDRNDFHGLLSAVAHLNDADAAATLTAAAAAAVRRGAESFPVAITRLLVAGGGRHNATMMAALEQALPFAVAPVESEGLNGDMLEAQAFAYLAVRVARGMATSGPTTTGVIRPLSGGQISLPKAT
ncbi:anhydro-N-acetylmuramic acid kinase [Neogemmobacter tilapiae]|uniref:Anhydro-N-acetylmuramic acid kinase n=1 Tax=Neogemmobacter tilapiae TaxID=875041 RepID=A0A918TGS4_9RHOB|nr:anhydro-N-acetylmuramic acid kinase [Gemmobacter tilapiae]GHC46123.1 anhydro-N-acetylmuramic acid kinase [Gemmobacter tilapiae]